MDIQTIAMIGLLAVSTIASIIGMLTGNKDLQAKAENKRQKTLNKLNKQLKKLYKIDDKNSEKIEKAEEEKEKLENE